MPLEIRITKQQLKFWLSMKKSLENNPNHYISKLIILADNTPYINFYKRLTDIYENPTNCQKVMTQTIRRKMKDKITLATENDEDSKLGTYLSINPSLDKPLYVGKLEFQRIIVTRYRTGSHNLRIERDRRIPNSRREDRLCVCNTGVQSIKHIFFNCPLLNDVRYKFNITDLTEDIFNEKFLLEMECILGIKGE